MPLRVMTWNIQYCQSGSRIDDIAAFIRQNTPDIVLLQEIAIRGRLSGALNQPIELGVRTGLPYRVFEADGDHGEVGNAVLSRFPLEGTQRLLFGSSESSILKTQAVINDVVHHIYTTHPREEYKIRACMELLSRDVGMLDPAHAVIVAGDFNTGNIVPLTENGRLTDIPGGLDDRREVPPGYDSVGDGSDLVDHLLFRGAYVPASLEVRHPFGRDLTDHAWHVVTLYEAAIRVLALRMIDVPERTADVDTVVDIEPNQCVELRAGGQIFAGVAFTRRNGPTGWTSVDHDPKFPLHVGPNAFPYSLIGRFGPAGEYFYVGRGRPRAPFTGPGAQRLLLRTNDDAPGNGTGAFTCRVIVSVDPAQPLRPNDAQLVSAHVPRTMEAGQWYAVSVIFRNIGTNTWTPGRTGYWLHSGMPAVWGRNAVPLPHAVATNEECTFSFTVRPSRAGRQVFRWRMKQQPAEWFGEETAVSVVVRPLIVE